MNIFGNKPWFKSLTAWGLLLIGVTQTYCAIGVEQGLPVAEMVCQASTTLGAILAGLGIRRAVNP